jgi:hypothetical protein
MEKVQGIVVGSSIEIGGVPDVDSTLQRRPEYGKGSFIWDY